MWPFTKNIPLTKVDNKIQELNEWVKKIEFIRIKIAKLISIKKSILAPSSFGVCWFDMHMAINVDPDLREKLLCLIEQSIKKFEIALKEAEEDFLRR